MLVLGTENNNTLIINENNGTECIQAFRNRTGVMCCTFNPNSTHQGLQGADVFELVPTEVKVR